MTPDLDKISSNLAQNLLALRRIQEMTQAALSRKAGIPRSTLTHIESGQGNPSLGNLVRIAEALGVSLEELVAPPRADCVLVPADEVQVQERMGGRIRIHKLLPRPVPGLEIDRIVLEPSAMMRGVPHLAGTREFLTCEQGAVQVYVAGETYTLEPGDLLAFPGDQNHSYANPGARTTVCFSIVALAADESG